MDNFFHVLSKDKWALEVLTFPEQFLIALVYPQVYMFKLFPTHWLRKDVSEC